MSLQTASDASSAAAGQASGPVEMVMEEQTTATAASEVGVADGAPAPVAADSPVSEAAAEEPVPAVVAEPLPLAPTAPVVITPPAAVEAAAEDSVSAAVGDGSAVEGDEPAQGLVLL